MLSCLCLPAPSLWAALPSAQQPGLPLIARTRSVHFEPDTVVSPHGRLSPIELPPGVVSPHGRVSPPARAKDKLQGHGEAAPAAGAQRPSAIKVICGSSCCAGPLALHLCLAFQDGMHAPRFVL